jgi:hypothetical protein
MAVNYSNYPQYRAAVEKARELQTQLYGTSDNKGLGILSKLDRIAIEQGENSADYQNLKARFDTLKAEHAKAAAVADAMRKEIDAPDIAAKKAKDDAAKKASISKDVNQLIIERDQLKRRDDIEGAKAKQAQIDAIKNPPVVDENGKEVVTADSKFSDYTLNGDGTITGKDGKPVVFVETKMPNGDIEAVPYQSKASARDAFLKNYQGEGGIAQLQKQLLASKYIKESEIKDGTWYKGLDDMLIAYSVKAVSDVKYGGLKQPEGLQAFITRQRGGTGTGTTKTYKVITTRGEAKQMLDNYLMDLTGSPSNSQEQESFYNQLHAAENKATQIVANGTSTGSTLVDADRIMIAAKVARNRLRNTDVDTILKAGTGSQVAVDIANLQKTASKYGVDMTAGEALQRVAAGVGQKDYINKQEERLRLIAKQLHPNLAAHIDAGGTVQDIADQYAYAKSKKLGVAVPVSTTDKDVMDAVSKGVSVSDFNRAMQAKPEWRNTEEAHTIANDYAQKILSSFGFGG